MIAAASPPSLRLWFQAARPKTLTAGVIPVLCATALAQNLGFDWKLWILIATLLASLLIQIATNFFNDAIDFKKGADTAARLGPARVSASGLIDVKKVHRAALAFCIGAACISIPLVLRGGFPILALGCISLFLAYGYTGGPFPLAYRGLGDLFVFIFFGLAAVLGAFFLQTGYLDFPPGVWVIGAQVGLWATVLIAVNNFRDSKEDRGNRKMTLAARFGATFSRLEITFLALSPYLLGALFWQSHGRAGAAFLPLLTLPLSLKVVISIWTLEPSERFNVLLAQSGVVHMLSGLLLSIALFFL